MEPGSTPARKFAFPSAITVLAAVTLAVWLLAFLIPSGRYERDADGAPVEGTYRRVESGQSLTDRFDDLFLAPVNGLYGIQDAASGEVGPDFSGELYGSAMSSSSSSPSAPSSPSSSPPAPSTGVSAASPTGCSRRGTLLIAGIMGIFSLLGTVEGWAEETLGFYGLIVPLMLALGYDRMVATGTIILGSGVGVLCSTVNPFATGVASSAAGISLGDGIVLRAAMWLVLTAVTIAYVARYASRVRRDPARSLSGFLPGDREQAAEAAGEPPGLTGLHRAVLVVVALVFAFMVFSVVPWSSALTGDADAEPYGFELGWSFPHLAALFLAAAVLVGLVARMGEQRLSATLVQGAGTSSPRAWSSCWPAGSR